MGKDGGQMFILFNQRWRERFGSWHWRSRDIGRDIEFGLENCIQVICCLRNVRQQLSTAIKYE
jgi:hypothetical protein